MAVTQQNVPAKLRHIQTFTSSGTFYPPAGTTVVFVSIHGASGGGGGARRRYSGNLTGGVGGVGKISGGYVQVNPQAPHSVVVGGGGAGGNFAYTGYYTQGYTGATGGTTSFDGAIFNFGGAGGNGAGDWIGNGNAGSAGSSNAQTALTTLTPSNSASPRVSGFSISNTNIAGGNGGTENQNNNGVSGAGGTSAIVHIYGY